MNLDFYKFTNQGGRDHNEDYCDQGGRDHNEDYCDLCAEGDSGIFIVADGLGGHSNGQIASETVTRSIIEDWENGGKEQVTNAENLETFFTESIKRANETLYQKCEEMGCTMKTTVVPLVIKPDVFGWAHVGDSRCYHIHNGIIFSVTDDHSVAYKKYKSGEIRRRDLATDEDQSALLRALGGQDRNTPDITAFSDSPASGDAFLLCSDGAWEFFDDVELLTDYTKARSAAEWVNLLLMRIIDRVDGKNDNLSILAVMVR